MLLMKQKTVSEFPKVTVIQKVFSKAIQMAPASEPQQTLEEGNCPSSTGATHSFLKEILRPPSRTIMLNPHADS